MFLLEIKLIQTKKHPPIEMAGFNTQLTRKMLMIFMACLQLIRNDPKVEAANSDSIPFPQKISNDFNQEEETQNNELNIRHFIPLSLSSDKTSDCVGINFLTKEVAHGVDVTNEPVRKESFEFLKENEINNDDESVENFCRRLNGVLPRHENNSLGVVFFEFPCLKAFKNSYVDSFYIATVTKIEVEGAIKTAEVPFKVYIPKNEAMTIVEMLKILFPGKKFINDIVEVNVHCLKDEHYTELKFCVFRAVMMNKVIIPTHIEELEKRTRAKSSNSIKAKKEQTESVQFLNLQNEKSFNSSNTTPITHEETNPDGEDDIKATPFVFSTQEEPTPPIATKTQEELTPYDLRFQEEMANMIATIKQMQQKNSKSGSKYIFEEKKNKSFSSIFWKITAVLLVGGILVGLRILIWKYFK
ncbi:hypothetical protein M153_5490002052 [Pseudoloma neurophilia]|uniref:Uncharacterized protein n=1 Tax=Pseudoloma neurophilia TaxID=146866 RepID=A0A0R0M2W8_9MICR|nr:hypothetical protein M153_5490002052 [Pseudoloma neurophilia]